MVPIVLPGSTETCVALTNRKLVDTNLRAAVEDPNTTAHIDGTRKVRLLVVV